MMKGKELVMDTCRMITSYEVVLAGAESFGPGADRRRREGHLQDMYGELVDNLRADKKLCEK
jgi:hypothetical protein